jgi:hypothetical protein
MKKVTKPCINQDEMLLENQSWCSTYYPQKTYGQMVEVIADILLDYLVHDGDPKNIVWAIGRALYWHKRENYLIADEKDYLYRFHEQLRKDVVRVMRKKLDLPLDNGNNG